MIGNLSTGPARLTRSAPSRDTPRTLMRSTADRPSAVVLEGRQPQHRLTILAVARAGPEAASGSSQETTSARNCQAGMTTPSA